MKLPSASACALFGIAALTASTVLPSPSEARTPVAPAGTTFQCTPIAVYDGDGPVWCREGPKIRIAGVAAREMDGSCRANQPCPQVAAIDARDRLVRLLGGPRGTLPEGHVVVRSATMTCVSEGSAGGSRTAAWCRSPAVGDLSCAVVHAGGAVRWARYWRSHRC
jgi:endonuclease YncB( thermonuclease family)